MEVRIFSNIPGVSWISLAVAMKSTIRFMVLSTGVSRTRGFSYPQMKKYMHFTCGGRTGDQQAYVSFDHGYVWSNGKNCCHIIAGVSALIKCVEFKIFTHQKHESREWITQIQTSSFGSNKKSEAHCLYLADACVGQDGKEWWNGIRKKIYMKEMSSATSS
ncbi:hypothetical protein TNIN_93911 [Trichonephila inaurata madagascariensis]|uniref:Uncharacterized protein n=1 Tax=Trichonephila inaurata madagascariensis TaxID=2747483 RepID=A0A8X6YSX4_9ARAC|nr:hypothetical protein TNIN_93911 [Trichonephila inaurata madagascariensis]